MTKRIRVLLAEQGRTAKSVATEAGIAEGTWYQRLRDPDSWRLAELGRVALIFDITLSELLRGVR